MTIRFTLDAWSAWAPGLDEPERWRAWAASPWLPLGDDMPALAEVPAMTRRRIDRIGRMALQCAIRVAGEAPCPMVFASRHGGVERNVSLLQALAREEALSPASFGLSVHNAPAALWSITRQDTGPMTAIAAGRLTPEAALAEAAGLLAEGAPAVIVVVYDEALPDCYAEYADEAQAFHAWALRVVPARDAHVALEVASGPPKPARDDTLPHGLQVLRFLISGIGQWISGDERSTWLWNHRAA